MSLRIISVAVAVDTEVELLASEDQTFIQGGQQHILSATQLINRDCKQSVIASRIAGHDGRVAVRSCLIRSDDLTLERIFQVDKLGLVEFKKSHINMCLVNLC